MGDEIAILMHPRYKRGRCGDELVIRHCEPKRLDEGGVKQSILLHR